MRYWIGGGCLAAVTAGGLAFVLADRHPSHVGPCVSGSCNVPTAVAPAGRYSDVVDVVPPAELARLAPAEPRRLPFASFDEPPFASVIIPASATVGPARIPPAVE